MLTLQRQPTLLEVSSGGIAGSTESDDQKFNREPLASRCIEMGCWRVVSKGGAAGNRQCKSESLPRKDLGTKAWARVKLEMVVDSAGGVMTFWTDCCIHALGKMRSVVKEGQE